MTSGELSALITAVGASIGAVIAAIAALINARNNAAKIAEAQKQIDDLRAQLASERSKAERQAIDNRNSIIYIGEDLARNRADNAKLALLVNQLFNQFKAATGQAPEIDLEMIRHLQTLSYITGPLGPLDIESVRRVQ